MRVEDVDTEGGLYKVFSNISRGRARGVRESLRRDCRGLARSEFAGKRVCNGNQKQGNEMTPDERFEADEKDRLLYTVAELRQQLAAFQSAVEHVTEDGCTRRSFSTSEGWAMVHKDRLHDLEVAEEQLAATEPKP